MALLLVVHMLVVRVVPLRLLVARVLMLLLQFLVLRMRCALRVSLFKSSSRRRADGALRLLIAHYKKQEMINNATSWYAMFKSCKTTTTPWPRRASGGHSAGNAEKEEGLN